MNRPPYALLLVAVLVSSAAADMIEYQVPGTPLVILLQGEPTFNPGGTVTLQHRLGTLYFSRDNILKRHKVPPLPAIFGRKLSKAKDGDAAMQAARWALKHGLLQQFYSAVEKARQLDPRRPDTARVLQLKRRIGVDLGPSAEQEAQLRRVVRRPNMKIKKSAHFILLHDTPEEPPKLFSRRARPRPPRADERLGLLEKVYESFLLKFYSQGLELKVPDERLKVVLFNQYEDYLDFATSLSPELRMTSGFYDLRSNISFFFDHGTSKRLKPLRDLTQQLQAKIPEAIKHKNGQFIRLAETLSLLVAIEQENSDIEVVSHETTHQMAGNTGLLPRYVLVPSWVHEGLATYFEAPDEATWSGMGAVNEERLTWYRALVDDREHSSLDFVVGDQIFKYALSQGALMHGYGQAWALTHFLMERHFDRFMRYYRRIGDMPPDVMLSPTVLNKLFDEAFTTDRKALENQWRSYMRSLKTDLEIILSNH